MRGAGLRRAAPIFSALGDETRLSLVARLGAGDRLSTSALTEGTAISRQGITKHLSVLAGAGLVRSVRAGRETLWELEPKRIQEAQKALDLIARHWDAALERLRALVELP
jgi:DNA-binding transcriptional ArsR family regulator